METQTKPKIGMKEVMDKLRSLRPEYVIAYAVACNIMTAEQVMIIVNSVQEMGEDELGRFYKFCDGLS